MAIGHVRYSTAGESKLENSQLPLKESVDCYTEACELLAFCMQELSESKGKIEDINTKLNNICTTDGDE